MSQAELREFLEAIERVRVEHTSTPEKALAFLQNEGMLTLRGDLAAPYAPGPSDDSKQPDATPIVA
jgi:hypothetical protein